MVRPPLLLLQLDNISQQCPSHCTSPHPLHGPGSRQARGSDSRSASSPTATVCGDVRVLSPLPKHWSLLSFDSLQKFAFYTFSGFGSVFRFNLARSVTVLKGSIGIIKNIRYLVLMQDMQTRQS